MALFFHEAPNPILHWSKYSRKCLTAPSGGADYMEIAPPGGANYTEIATFLASTVGDGKSELLQKKQRRARALWHLKGPPPPPWQLPFQKKKKTSNVGAFEERFARTHRSL